MRMDGSNDSHFKYVLNVIATKTNKLCSKDLTVQQAVRCIQSIIVPSVSYASEAFH
jgi:hypothetical protein